MVELDQDHLPGPAELLQHTNLTRLHEILRHHLLVPPPPADDDLTIQQHAVHVDTVLGPAAG